MPGTVLEQWDGRNAHQPQTGAAKAADSSRSGRVLSPGGTRLAPTEAERRPVACCPERSGKMPQDRTRQIYLPGTVLEQWDERSAHQPQTGAAKAADSSRSGRVLSPGGTRLAPTEAERRPVACCPERSEKLTRLNFLPGNAILKRRLQKSQWKEKEKEREETDIASS